jgi:hypothetical protein
MIDVCRMAIQHTFDEATAINGDSTVTDKLDCDDAVARGSLRGPS